MVDGIGSWSLSRKFLESLVTYGVEVRVHTPGRLWALINRRNHRKTLLVDHRRLWVGSMNITARHSERHSLAFYHQRAWKDVAIALETTPESKECVELSAAFEQTWQNAWRVISTYDTHERKLGHPSLIPPLRPMLSNLTQLGSTLGNSLRRGRPHYHLSLLRLNYQRQLRRRLNHDLMRRIMRAKTRVWITTPYFVPRRRLSRLLGQAAWRGVDVRIVLPYESDVPWLRWVTSAFAQRLLTFGVRIFEYRPAILHAKLLMIDDWATIGSTNLNHRSFMHDLECDAVLSLEATKKQLDALVLELQKNSIELKSIQDFNLDFFRRILGKMLFAFRKYF
jgi:cardiolipin synthase